MQLSWSRALVPTLVLGFAVVEALASSRLMAAENQTGNAADAQVLAGARAQSLDWQRHLSLTSSDLSSPDQTVRINAVAVLADSGDPAVAGRLAVFAATPERDAEEVLAAVLALHRLGVASVLPTLSALGNHRDPQVRMAALHAVDRLGQPERWRQEISDPDPIVHKAALSNEAIQGPNESAAALVLALRDERDPSVRRLAAYGLGRLGDKTVAGLPLVNALADVDEGVRRNAAEALVKLDHTPAIPFIIRLLDAGVNDVHLGIALDKLSKQSFGFHPELNAVQKQMIIAKADTWWSLSQTPEAK